MLTEKLQNIFTAYAQSGSLQTLNLSSNNLGAMTAGQWQALGAALARCKSLQTINLGRNNLGAMTAGQWQALGAALAQCESLQTLILCCNDLRAMEVWQWQALGAALAQCKSLQTIDFGYNMLVEMTVGQFQALGAALAQCRSLQTLNLHSNVLGLMAAEQWQALGAALARCKSLRAINLRQNNLGTAPGEQLAKFFAGIPSFVTSINADYNGLNNRTMEDYGWYVNFRASELVRHAALDEKQVRKHVIGFCDAVAGGEAKDSLLTAFRQYLVPRDFANLRRVCKGPSALPAAKITPVTYCGFKPGFLLKRECWALR